MLFENLNLGGFMCIFRNLVLVVVVFATMMAQKAMAGPIDYNRIAYYDLVRNVEGDIVKLEANYENEFKGYFKGVIIASVDKLETSEAKKLCLGRVQPYGFTYYGAVRQALEEDLPTVVNRGLIYYETTTFYFSYDSQSIKYLYVYKQGEFINGEFEYYLKRYRVGSGVFRLRIMKMTIDDLTDN